MQLKKDELKVIYGGGFVKWMLAGLLSAGVLISGIVDGFLRPNQCKG